MSNIAENITVQALIYIGLKNNKKSLLALSFDDKKERQIYDFFSNKDELFNSYSYFKEQNFKIDYLQTLIAPKSIEKIEIQHDSILLSDFKSQSISIPISFKDKILESKRNLEKFFDQNSIFNLQNKKNKIIDKKKTLNIDENFPPRNYQEKCVDALSKTNRGLIHAPTGSGKTNIMAYLIAKLNTRTLIIVPTKDLVQQTWERFAMVINESDIKLGYIDGTVKDKQFNLQYADVVVTTWQSIKKSMFELIKERFENIIVDECHHSSANVLHSTLSIIGENKNLYGVSATPYRSNEEDYLKILKLFGNNITYRVDIENLYKDGFLVRPDVNIISTGNYDFQKVNILNFVSKMLEKKNSEIKRYDDFIDKILKIGYYTIKLLNGPRFIGHQLEKQKLNGEYEKISGYDIAKTAKYWKSALIDYDLSDAQKKELVINFILERLHGDNKSSFIFDENILNSDYAIFLPEIYRIYTLDYLDSHQNLKIENWEDFAQKIGYLKKFIDSDAIRQKYIYHDMDIKIENNPYTKAIVLANSIDFAQKIEKRYLDKGKRVFYLDGKTKDKASILEDIKVCKDDSFLVIATTDLIKEGIDIPVINTVFAASPVNPPFNASYSLEQIIGRGIRPFKDKKNADIYIYDSKALNFKDKSQGIFSIIKENVKPKRVNFITAQINSNSVDEAFGEDENISKGIKI